LDELDGDFDWLCSWTIMLNLMKYMHEDYFKFSRSDFFDIKIC
jgi:hypothetical protein